MQEFYVAATRKLGMPALATKAVLETFSVFEIVQISPELIQDAIDCAVLNTLSFWDALIIAAAASVDPAVGSLVHGKGRSDRADGHVRGARDVMTVLRFPFSVTDGPRRLS